MILSTLLALAGAAQTQKPNCDTWLSQNEMNGCTRLEFERADAEMNAQWKKAVAKSKAWDREPEHTPDGRPGYFETLLAAQRAWLVYRDQHCMREGYIMRGGSAEPYVYNTCRSRLTKARTAELKVLAEGKIN
jgi:uncharacterized protein YecT (DUF1311 family)